MRLICIFFLTGEPEKPTIIVLKSSANYIYVEFEHGNDGGYPQTFIIEYRKASAGPWTQITVDNSHTYYYIKDLESETEYTLQMYSFNKIGNSTIAEDYSIYTKLAKGILLLCMHIVYSFCCTF